MNDKNSKGYQKVLFCLLIIAGIVLIWSILYLVIQDPMSIASPVQAFRTLSILVLEVAFWQSVSVSLIHILGGCLLGCAIGALLFMAECCTPLSDFLRVARKFFRVIPVLPFLLILASVLFENLHLLLLVAPLSASAGVLWERLKAADSTLDPKVLFMATCGSKTSDVWRYLRLPNLILSLSSSLRAAWLKAFGIGIVVEFIVRLENSLGGGFANDFASLQTELLFARTIAIAVLCFLLYGLVYLLTEKIRYFPYIEESADFARNGHSYPIVFDRINKSYDDLNLFVNFSYVFPNGKVTAVHGVRESGKTTLLLMAAGIYNDDENRFEFPPTAPAIILKDPCLNPYLTVRENLLYVNPAANVEKILKSLALLKVTDFYPHQLDFSTQKRVAIARAIAFNGGIGIFDEPFEGMDDETKALSAAALFGAYKGKTVIFATPYKDDAERFGEEVLKL